MSATAAGDVPTETMLSKPLLPEESQPTPLKEPEMPDVSPLYGKLFDSCVAKSN
ncbi:predicted protein [Arabidopsis lyrata subsp. lyrata]|uniref:Predicted protein n=1 Tax=Arabidopsis lyrata subsp. lyrata TaxID=81972 RepID=D7M6Y3_ARALL|nr:predicted protein [Arabidopsis lyrata subsp. lyrata]